MLLLKFSFKDNVSIPYQNNFHKWVDLFVKGYTAPQNYAQYSYVMLWSVFIQLILLILFDMMTSSNGNIFRITGHLCRGIHRSPVNSPHKGQWRGALMFSLICTWINGWINNREVGNLRCYCAHDIIVTWSYCTDVMISLSLCDIYRLCAWSNHEEKLLSASLILYDRKYATHPWLSITKAP